jgi:hypothetical protein
MDGNAGLTDELQPERVLVKLSHHGEVPATDADL